LTSTEGRPKRPPPCRWRCSANWSPPATALPAAGATALLLFGFAGALRRSELVALRVEDVKVDADGLLSVRTRRPAGGCPPATLSSPMGSSPPEKRRARRSSNSARAGRRSGSC
jgi:integrase